MESMAWTAERVEQLRRLWLDGLSASRIAAELSNGVTRNAVIGKVHRLGLSGRAKSAAPSAASQRPKATRPPPRRSAVPLTRGATALALKPSPIVDVAPAPRTEVVIPLSERVTIMELRESMCRWPLGDPSHADFRFCGARSSDAGQPYCAAHARIAFQPAQDRRRDRRPLARSA